MVFMVRSKGQKPRKLKPTFELRNRKTGKIIKCCFPTPCDAGAFADKLVKRGKMKDKDMMIIPGGK